MALTIAKLSTIVKKPCRILFPTTSSTSVHPTGLLALGFSLDDLLSDHWTCWELLFFRPSYLLPHAQLLFNFQAQFKCHLLGWAPSWWPRYLLSYFLLHCVVDCLHGMYPNLYYCASKLFFWLISCLFEPCISCTSQDVWHIAVPYVPKSKLIYKFQVHVMVIVKP